MRIVFICGSLQAGCDGVGDYTRQLAAACEQRQNPCAIIALNEHGISDSFTSEFGTITCLHLASSRPWTERLSQAIDFRSRFAPDWVSWQLVGYGLEGRGIVPRVVRRKAYDLCGLKCHVMVHELWLGLEASAGWKAKGLGWLQRRSVLGLLHRIRPARIDTSNFTYQRVLKNAGFASGVLRLFGNIPVKRSAKNAAIPFIPSFGSDQETSDSPHFLAITFGTLHPQWKAEATALWLKELSARLGKSPTLIAIGRVGSQSRPVFDAFARHQIAVVATGDQSADVVSAIMQAADIGIAPHPWALVGKSGAAAAMLDHGLPVLVPRDDWNLRIQHAPSEPDLDGNLRRLDGLTPPRTDAWLASKRPPEATLSIVASDFLLRLSESLPTTPNHQ